MKKRPYKFYDTWDNPFAVKALELQDKINYMKQVITLLSIVNVVLLGVIIL